MTDFTTHDIESAPEGSKPLLEKSQKAFGMIPNLHGVFAESPQALEGYQELHRLFQETSLKTDEKHVVWLTVSVTNACHYCIPAHTGLAKMDGVSDDVIEAIREQREISDDRLEALRRFTRAMVEQRGQVDDEAVQRFLDAGFSKRNILDIVVGVAQKVLSNYTNHLADTEIDEPFRKFAEGEPASVQD